MITYLAGGLKSLLVVLICGFCNSVTILLYILINYSSLSHIGCENVRYGWVGWCKVLICKWLRRIWRGKAMWITC